VIRWFTGVVNLPAGTYRVRITDQKDGPRLRSFTREVKISAGSETNLLIDLELEGVVSSAEGSTFNVPNDPERRLRIIQTVASRKVGRGVFLWLDNEDLHAVVIDPVSGQIVRYAMVKIPGGTYSSFLSGAAKRSQVHDSLLPILGPRKNERAMARCL
jgi:hypothetical protein